MPSGLPLAIVIGIANPTSTSACCTRATASRSGSFFLSGGAFRAAACNRELRAKRSDTRVMCISRAAAVTASLIEGVFPQFPGPDGPNRASGSIDPRQESFTFFEGRLRPVHGLLRLAPEDRDAIEIGLALLRIGRARRQKRCLRKRLPGEFPIFHV